MLTIRKIGVTVGDREEALRKAQYSLELADSPQAFRRADYYTDREPGLDEEKANAMWLGTPRALAALGVERGGEVMPEQLATALQGRHTLTGEQVRRPGTRQVEATDENGPLKDPDGNPYMISEQRVNSVDLTFSAPKSVSVVWSQAGPAVRAAIERAMLRSANAMLTYMTQTKPVVQGVGEPAHGFVASAALQVTARRARDEEVPSPQLHVHGVLVGIEDEEGRLKTPGTDALFKHDAPLEGGAIGRAVLAEELRELGFELDWGTGKHGRFFEIRGVPQELIDVWSARTREVEREQARLERELGRKLSGAELAAIAQKTRIAKDKDLPAEKIMRYWDAIAREHGFTAARIEELRARGIAVRSSEELLGEARTAIVARMWEHGPTVSAGMARAIAFELAPMGLSLEELRGLLDDMQRSGELIALEDGRVTTAEIRGLEREVVTACSGAARRGRGPLSREAVDRGTAAAQRRLGEHRPLDGDQLEAIRSLTQGHGWTTLTGLAGTGKGPVLQAVSEAHRADGWRVIACAVDGSTAQRLGKQVEARAYTIEQVLYGVEHGTLTVDDRTLVVIDEASKVGLRHWAQLAKLSRERQIAVLAVGHTGQLGAIELPGMFEVMLRLEAVPTAELTTIRRHRDPLDPEHKEHPWLGDYQQLLDKGTPEAAAEAIALLREHDAIRMHETRAEAIDALVEHWDERRRLHLDPRDAILVVHGSNEDVDRVNELAQAKRVASGDLRGQGVQAADRSYRIYEGDVVMLRAGPYEPEPGEIGWVPRVENGAIGIVDAVDAERGTLWVLLEEPGMRPRRVRIDRQALLEQRSALRLAYAFHPFPLQGATRKDVLVLDGHWSQYKEATYSADTRAELYLHKHTDRETLGTEHSEEECWELLARRWSTSQNRQASILLAATGGRIAVELQWMLDPPEFPARTRRGTAEAAKTIGEAIGDRDRAESRIRDPLAPHAPLLGERRAGLIDTRARDVQREIRDWDLGSLLRLRGEARGAFESLDRSGARATVAAERDRRIAAERVHTERGQADALEARAQSGVLGRGERRQLSDAAEARRRIIARDKEALAQVIRREDELRSSGRHLDVWMSREAERAAWSIAIERELQVRRELATAAVVEWSVVDPPEQLCRTLGPPPGHSARDREEWETLARELERERLGAAVDHDGIDAAGDEPERPRARRAEEIDAFRQRRGLEPLDPHALEPLRGGELVP
jgi:conjugative relaxase-like TrwC/TraI family protein